MPWIPPQPIRPEIYPMTGGGNYPVNPSTPVGQGGEIGVQSDYDLRNGAYAREFDAYINGQLAAWNANRDAAMWNWQNALRSNDAIRERAAGMLTAADRGAAIGQLGGSRMIARQGAVDGGISDAEFEQGVGAARQVTAQKALAMQGAINSALAQRGVTNPYAGLVVNMAGQFAAGGEAGRARAGLTAQRAQNRLGYAGLLGNLDQTAAGIAATPTQESALSVQIRPQDMPKMPVFTAPDFSGGRPIYDYFQNRDNPRAGNTPGSTGSGGGYRGPINWSPVSQNFSTAWRRA